MMVFIQNLRAGRIWKHVVLNKKASFHILDEISSKRKAIKSLREQHSTSMNDLLSSTTLFKGFKDINQPFGFERGEKDYQTTSKEIWYFVRRKR